VGVITGVPHYPEWRRMPSPPMPDRPHLRVRRYLHYIPRRPTAFGRMVYEASFLVSATRGVLPRRIDAAIGVVPTLSGAALAMVAARRSRAGFGVIFQDLMGAAASQSGYQGGRRVARAITAAEGFLARRADQIAVISEGFRPYVEGLGVAPDRIVRVRNWAHLAESSEPVERTRERLRWGATDFICLHAGNIGHKQGLDNVLEAARLASDPQLRFVISGEGNDRPRLAERAQRLGLTNVSFLPLQPEAQFASMLRAADILILNQRGSVTDMALPSKLSTYLLAGRPVVAALALGSNAALEFESAGAGIAVPPDDPLALLQAITRIQASPELAKEMGGHGRDFAVANLVADRALEQYDVFVDRLLEARRH
jgi:glycosyltransferase involved in cell wall biosynthesis